MTTAAPRSRIGTLTFVSQRPRSWPSAKLLTFAGLRQLLLVGRPAGLLQPHFLTCRAQSTRPHGCSSATKTRELTAGSAATTAFASSSFAASKTAAPPASSENGPPDLSDPLT